MCHSFHSLKYLAQNIIYNYKVCTVQKSPKEEVFEPYGSTLEKKDLESCSVDALMSLKSLQQ